MSGYHLAIFSTNGHSYFLPLVGFPPSSTLHPYGSAYGIDYTSKNFLKRWAIQLVIHLTVGVQTDYE